MRYNGRPPANERLRKFYDDLSVHDADCYPRPDLGEGVCDCGASEIQKLRDELQNTKIILGPWLIK